MLDLATRTYAMLVSRRVTHIVCWCDALNCCLVEACCVILFRCEYGIQAIQELVRSAGPGGAHEHTVLMVFGDHGQTMTGDHGGGAPEEVDSALFALHMGAYHGIRSDCASSPLATAQCCVHIMSVIQLWWLPAAANHLMSVCTCGALHNIVFITLALVTTQACRGSLQKSKPCFGM